MIGDVPSVAFRESRAVLVGREREQRRLREFFAAAREGRGGAVLIGGEAGIGKTALAEATLWEAAAAGAIVLTGRCYDRTETPPYGPWVEIFGDSPVDGGRPPPALVSIGEPGSGIGSQANLFAKGRDYLAALAHPQGGASRPIVILLDDLHWADAGSLDFLRYLARSLATLPILALLTYRADELTREHPLYTLLPLLVREAGAARLDLRRLDEEDVRALVRARYRLSPADEDWTVGHLQGRAEGNPFFIGELLRTLEEEERLRMTPSADGRTIGWTLGERTRIGLPPLLRQVLNGRFARLGAVAERLLAVAAVLGSEVSFDLWSVVSGVSEDEILDVVEAAGRAHLLTEGADGRHVTFTHALIRETLYEELSPTRRARWHRLAGEALLQAAGGNPDPDLVAYHFGQAGDPRAADWLVRAGERAQRVYAHLTAATRFEAALAIMREIGADRREQGWILYRLARLRRYATPQEGLGRLAEAAQLAAEAGDRALAAHALYYRGFLLCTTGQLRRGLVDLADGVAALAALDETERAGLAARGLPLDVSAQRGMLCSWLAEVGRYHEAEALGLTVVAQEPTRPSAGWDGASRGDAWFGLARAHVALGRPDEAATAFERARTA